jgi:hypothetical protein
MQKILIMVFALALNSGLSLQASGEPARPGSDDPFPSVVFVTKSLKDTQKCRRPECLVGQSVYECTRAGCGQTDGGLALYCNVDCASKDLNRHLEADACFALKPGAE